MGLFILSILRGFDNRNGLRYGNVEADIVFCSARSFSLFDYNEGSIALERDAHTTASVRYFIRCVENIFLKLVLFMGNLRLF